VQGLKGAAQLNGQAGHIVNWNVDGRRRYGVRLEGSGKLVSCPMRSVVPLDKPWLAYPHDFECSSTEIVATLQSELRAQGSSLTVLDWTPLAAAVSDVVYLLHVAHEISLIDFVHSTMQAIADDDDADGDMQSKKRAVLADCRAAQDVLIFVLSDAQTAPFFLAHREFISPGATIHSNAEIAAVPWLASVDVARDANDETDARDANDETDARDANDETDAREPPGPPSAAPRRPNEDERRTQPGGDTSTPSASGSRLGIATSSLPPGVGARVVRPRRWSAGEITPAASECVPRN
jgi:hypothetical protein